MSRCRPRPPRKAKTPGPVPTGRRNPPCPIPLRRNSPHATLLPPARTTHPSFPQVQDQPPQTAQQSLQASERGADPAQSAATPTSASNAATKREATPQSEEVNRDNADASDVVLREVAQETDNQAPTKPSDAATEQEAKSASEQKIAKSVSGETSDAEQADRKPQAAALNEFVQSVSGKNRDLVLKVLEADRRLLKTIEPAEQENSILQEARDRSLDRLRQAAQQGFPAA